MKAIVWTKYGGPEVLKYGVFEKPTPKSSEVKYMLPLLQRATADSAHLRCPWAFGCRHGWCLVW